MQLSRFRRVRSVLGGLFGQRVRAESVLYKFECSCSWQGSEECDLSLVVCSVRE